MSQRNKEWSCSQLEVLTTHNEKLVMVLFLQRERREEMERKNIFFFLVNHGGLYGDDGAQSMAIFTCGDD